MPEGSIVLNELEKKRLKTLSAHSSRGVAHLCIFARKLISIFALKARVLKFSRFDRCGKGKAKHTKSQLPKRLLYGHAALGASTGNEVI